MKKDKTSEKPIPFNKLVIIHMHDGSTRKILPPFLNISVFQLVEAISGSNLSKNIKKYKYFEVSG